MLQFYRKYYKTIFDVLLLIVTIYLFMRIFSYLYQIATPIFLAFLIYAINEPLARFLHKRGIRKNIAATLSTLVFVIVILSIAVGAGAIFLKETGNLEKNIPLYSSYLENQIQSNSFHWESRFNNLPPAVMAKIKDYSSTLASEAGNIAVNFLKVLAGQIGHISSFVISFAVGTILAYFLSLEIETWKRTAREKTPRTFRTMFQFLKKHVFFGLAAYIKAQLKLITITFFILFIALLIMGIKNAFSIALLSAFFDLLPMLGVSTIFIPWIIYLFIVGNVHLAVWLCIVLGIVILVRQIMEPKITGDSLGVSAFTILSFMVISLSIFGVAGVILSPILILLLKALYEQGYLKRWIRLPEDEFD